MTCFIISEYYRIMGESNKRIENMVQTFEDGHIFPQNW